MITAAHLQRCINAAQLAGFTHYATALLALYRREYALPAPRRGQPEQGTERSEEPPPRRTGHHLRDHRTRTQSPTHC